MRPMSELIKLLKELDDQLAVCMRCGMCQSVCPLYAETGREADVARGKLALLDGLARKMIADPQGVNQRLTRCLLCGSCAANCPSGVSVLNIFIKARAIMAAYLGMSPVKKALFRKMLAHPKFFDQLAEWGARFQKLFTRPVNDILGTSCARIESSLIGDRHMVPLARIPFHRIMPSVDMPARQGQVRVAFFVGCLLDKIFPSVAQAVMRVLAHHQVAIYLPANQGCCGIPALASGDTNGFSRLLSHNLNLFDPARHRYDYLITACATCTSTIKKIWPVMAQAGNLSGYEAIIEKIGEKTVDIHQFLVNELGIDTPPTSTPDARTVTYHDPCHLKKSLKVFQEPRILIDANGGYQRKEMLESDWCCGMGGSFNLFHYEISASIADRKRANILATGCDTVATGCPACMIQITDTLSKAQAPVIVKHAIEIYAEGLHNR